VLGSIARYFYTNVKVKPEHWDEAKLKVKNKPSIEHIKLNNQIRDIQGKIGKIVEQCTREGKVITCSFVKSKLEPEVSTKYLCFHSFMKTEIDKRNDVCADIKRPSALSVLHTPCSWHIHIPTTATILSVSLRTNFTNHLNSNIK